MMPGSGFDVAEVQDGHYFTARAPDQTMSWCLAVEPLDQHSCRLISRWRARWHVTLASAAWIALSDPGAFIMERRMLLGIKARAEQAVRPGLARDVPVHGVGPGRCPGWASGSSVPLADAAPPAWCRRRAWFV